MKKISKAFEKWVKSPYSKKEEQFVSATAPNRINIDQVMAKAYYAGYKAGQKAEREKDSFMWRVNDDLTPLEGLKVTITGHPVEDPTEWIPLELDNLPAGIFTDGIFEVETYIHGFWFPNADHMKKLYQNVVNDLMAGLKMRYRPIQKEPEDKKPVPMGQEAVDILKGHRYQPTHEKSFREECEELDSAVKALKDAIIITIKETKLYMKALKHFDF